MRFRTAQILLAALLLAIPAAMADSQPADSQPADSKPIAADLSKPMSGQVRMMVIRSLTAEFVFARRPLPGGEKGLIIKDGKVLPEGQDLDTLLAKFGPAVKPGERAQITSVDIKGKSIFFVINGGAKKKSKWYQHVQVGMGGMTSPQTSDQPLNPKGTSVELAFDKFVPEITGDQIRELLSPVLDFHAMSAVEAYLETVPPQVKEAIKNHQVLVGMNREMVGYAKGKPEQRIRETDPVWGSYEEWIYGQPPQEVQFVRFVGDQVARLEIMKVDGTKVVRTDKEVVLKEQPKPASASVEDMEEKKPATAPTLRRPGEAPDPLSTDKNSKGTAPTGQPETAPQWDPNRKPTPN